MSKGAIFEYEGIRFRAQDDEIISLLSDAAVFEVAGTAGLQTAIRIAVEYGRLTRADLPTPVGCV